eukprot:CAMPEP_0171481462 /NCGR_PEP_ID=MMETSP0946-20130122/6761_1 /TAXON_ID=109269 /ORGANISM="Vaucheria litorea, Strain CCMP2940" /LENGTH=220 /DNA_ID=CAMNT_0012013041 /DNA_START=10 /DNA_END=672 /DNA_ORIENTATION=+
MVSSRFSAALLVVVLGFSHAAHPTHMKHNTLSAAMEDLEHDAMLLEEDAKTDEQLIKKCRDELAETCLHKGGSQAGTIYCARDIENWITDCPTDENHCHVETGVKTPVTELSCKCFNGGAYVTIDEDGVVTRGLTHPDKEKVLDLDEVKTFISTYKAEKEKEINGDEHELKKWFESDGNLKEDKRDEFLKKKLADECVARYSDSGAFEKMTDLVKELFKA